MYEQFAELIDTAWLWARAHGEFFAGVGYTCVLFGLIYGVYKLISAVKVRICAHDDWCPDAATVRLRLRAREESGAE